MAVDILNLEPHKVSKDLRGYSFCIYGAPKSGKTTVAASFPDALILAFEKGYNALPGAKIQPINSWHELRQEVRQLKKPEAQNLYQTVVFDTMDLAYISCEKFICSKHDVGNIQDIPYGQGYAEVSREMDDVLQTLAGYDYAIVLISHAKDKVFKDEQGAEYQKIVSTLPATAWNIVNRFCDIIGYVRITKDPETGEEATFMYQRGTVRFEAGSRFKYSSKYIPFTYENIVNDVYQALLKIEEETQGMTKEEKEKPHVAATIDYDSAINEFKNVASRLKNIEGEDEVYRIMEEVLGTNKRISDVPKDKPELIQEINERIQERISELE